MNQTRKNLHALLQTAVSAVFALGMLTFLKPCGPGADGSYMHCHTTGRFLLAAACVMLAAGILSWLVPRCRIPGSIVTLLCAAAVLAVPGPVLGLCMMPQMRCRAVMRPGAAVFAVLMILVTIPALLKALSDHRKGV